MLSMFQERMAPAFPPAPRTPVTSDQFQPPYFPPPFSSQAMLQPHSVQAEVFSSAMQPLHSADPYQVSSSLQQFQQVRHIVETRDQGYGVSPHTTGRPYTWQRNGCGCGGASRSEQLSPMAKRQPDSNQFQA